LSLLHSVQTGSGPTQSPIFPSNAEVKNDGAIPPLLARLHGLVLN
jgi:hypothetical protein